MPNRSAAIKDAQSEIKRLETLKSEIMGRMPAASSPYEKMMRKAFLEEVAKIDKKIAVAKKTLASATSAADLVDKDALNEPKPKRKKITSNQNPWDELEEKDNSGRSLGDRLKGVLKETVGDYIDEELGDKDQDVADAATGIFEDMIDGGGKKQVGNKIKGRLKNLLGDKVEDLIENEVGDKDVADALRGVVETAMSEGLNKKEIGKRLKEEVKDLLGDKVGGLLDKKVKDEDVADALRDIIGDVVDTIADGEGFGKLKGKIGGRLKELAGDKLEDLINEEVKDEDIRDALQAIVDDVEDGITKEELGKRIKAELKNLLGDKAGDLIDKNIADDRIADVLKEIFGELLDGDWEGALDAAKDGVVALAKDELDKLIEKFMPEAEVFIIKQMEIILEKHVKGLISQAFDQVRKKVGPDMLVGQFVTNVTERILKASIDIIHEEIVKYIQSGGLQRILSVAKDAAIDEIANNLKSLKDFSIKNIWKAIKESVINDPEFQKAITHIKGELLLRFVIIIEEEVDNTFGAAMDAFLLRYANWSGTLLDTKKQEVKIGPFWGCVNLALSIDANLSASLNTTRDRLKATMKGKIAGTALAGVGINVGFNIPMIGGVSIEGGVQGGPELAGSASISLGLKHGVMTGSMVPAQLTIDMVARLYLELPDLIPDSIIKKIPKYVPKTSARDNTVYYNFGSINVLLVTTPSYKLSFDILKGNYTYLGPEGKYLMQVNPEVKQRINEIKEAILAAAKRWEEKYNPIKVAQRIEWDDLYFWDDDDDEIG